MREREIPTTPFPVFALLPVLLLPPLIPFVTCLPPTERKRERGREREGEREIEVRAMSISVADLLSFGRLITLLRQWNKFNKVFATCKSIFLFLSLDTSIFDYN